jgi:hypothetical protein
MSICVEEPVLSTTIGADYNAAIEDARNTLPFRTHARLSDFEVLNDEVSKRVKETLYGIAPR